MLALTVADKTPLTDRITEFRLVSRDGGTLPDYTPGAHIDVTTPAGLRSYSLIDWPGSTAEDYEIAVQREEGGDGGSRAMHGLQIGDSVDATPPANDFELTTTDRPVVLLAGGIGVTPLISMATALATTGHDFAFHYAGRAAGQMAYLAEIEQAFGTSFTAHFDDVAAIDLAALAGTLSDHAFYICGRKGMIDAARAAAEAAGVSPDHIHVELFATKTDTGGNTPFEVEIASSGQVITVGADQSIIEALEDAGIDLIYDCQRGDCGICQTDIIAGTPDHRDVVLSQAEKDSGKVMQICVSRALTDRLVLDL